MRKIYYRGPPLIDPRIAYSAETWSATASSLVGMEPVLLSAVAGMQRCQHCCRPERYGSQPSAGRVERRIRDRRRHYRSRRFARAPWCLVGPINQVDGNVRNVRKSQNRVASPIEARHSAPAEGQFFDQSAAHCLHYSPFDLVAQSVGVYDLTCSRAQPTRDPP